jgi:arginine/lysine/ornithine decarboxylase
MYLSDMVPAMKPADAFAKMAHREIDRVPIDELEGRITSVLLTPYPPGIPLLIPGERFNARSFATCSSPASSTSASRASRPTSTAW